MAERSACCRGVILRIRTFGVRGASRLGNEIPTPADGNRRFICGNT
jgi:hypothetical protein